MKLVSCTGDTLVFFVSSHNMKMAFLYIFILCAYLPGLYSSAPTASFERALAQTAAANAQAAAAAADELREAVETAARSEARLRAKIDELRAALRCVDVRESERDEMQSTISSTNSHVLL